MSTQILSASVFSLRNLIANKGTSPKNSQKKLYIIYIICDIYKANYRFKNILFTGLYINHCTFIVYVYSLEL